MQLHRDLDGSRNISFSFQHPNSWKCNKYVVEEKSLVYNCKEMKINSLNYIALFS